MLAENPNIVVKIKGFTVRFMLFPNFAVIQIPAASGDNSAMTAKTASANWRRVYRRQISPKFAGINRSLGKARCKRAF